LATLRWDQVVTVTRTQAKQSLLELLRGLGFTATSWQEGSVPLALVEIGSEVWAQCSGIAVFIKNLALNETSEGESLTRLSRSHYANDRDISVAGQRETTLTCSPTEGPYIVNIGDVVVAHADGATFRNVAGLAVAYPVTLTSGGSVTLLTEAEIAGSSGTFADGTVTTMVTTLSGVTVTVDLKERDGLDEESDPRLRARNSSKWASIGEFELIRDRVENIALNASAAIQTVGIDDNNPRGAGTFDVYVAGSALTAGSTEVTLAQAAFNLRVFGLDTCRVYAAPEVPLNLVATIYYAASFSLDDVQASVEGIGPAIDGSLVTFIKTIPLGGFEYTPSLANVVRRDDIVAAIKNATVSGQTGAIRTVVITSPAVEDFPVTSFGKVVMGTPTLTYVPVNG
jgi:hypothetical protein